MQGGTSSLASFSGQLSRKAASRSFAAFLNMLMFSLGTDGFLREIHMTRRTHKRKLYTVVEVWRGLAAGAKNFTRLQDAENYAQRLRKRCNLLEDDVQLFESSIRLSS